MAFEDYYLILGVKKDATDLQIRKAYRRLVLQFHPDRNPGDKAAEDQFKKIAAAYQALSDPEEREEYDLTRREFDEAAHAAFRAQAAENRRKQHEEQAAESARRFRERQTRRGSGMRRSAQYRIESNELEQLDVVQGIVAGAVASALCSIVISPSATGGALLWSLVPIVGGPVGYAAGKAARAILEGVFNVLSDFVSGIELLGAGLPLLLALVGACAALSLGHFFHFTLFTWRAGPGAMAAGLGSVIGSAFGRAFTSVAEHAHSKAIGVAFGAAVGAFFGAISGGFFAIFLLTPGAAGLAFFNGLLVTATGGAIGGALASVLGSLRRPAN